jgi:hypothetical protein
VVCKEVLSQVSLSVRFRVFPFDNCARKRGRPMSVCCWACGASFSSLRNLKVHFTKTHARLDFAGGPKATPKRPRAAVMVADDEGEAPEPCPVQFTVELRDMILHCFSYVSAMERANATAPSECVHCQGRGTGAPRRCHVVPMHSSGCVRNMAPMETAPRPLLRWTDGFCKGISCGFT